ncbi:L-erythro-3,5-diaminohexanoate dehydrogenase [Dongia deserti]|uniref:L-erythro-3,5-diaminohexanoate dehydrogenase n=1 Tax=Dongia deserti TaxID=2268030 RepID=UPI000E65C62E|nr:L-erythro-3,5-diaminohexanoate dehydrogenase [Dongia deserti]
MPAPCPFGSHRAGGGLPQSAERLDASLPIRCNELLIAIEHLHLDSSSMRQIGESCGHDDERMRAQIAEIVRTRGKMHNPVTGSGGVLVGRISEIGPDFPVRDIAVGDVICTLVSLTLTPLHLHKIGTIDERSARVEAEGHAILFASGLYTKLPSDIPQNAAMALCDVAGAPGHVAKLAQPDQTICVLGCGRAGLLSLCAARQAMGRDGLLIGLDASRNALNRANSLHVADALPEVDLRDALATHQAVARATDGRLADLTIVTTNVPGCEGGAILATRPKGRVLFFSMATSFTAAALTAEGVGRDVEMIIGNGYTDGWVETAFSLYRSNPTLTAAFQQL